MKNIFITITGLNHYLGSKPFKIGRIVKLVKDIDNPHDTKAIRVELPFIDTIGYVANSTNTVYAGTYSAGRLYETIGDYAYAQVMFITHSGVIAVVLPPEAVEQEQESQQTENFQTDVEILPPTNKKSTPRQKIGF